MTSNSPKRCVRANSNTIDIPKPLTTRDCQRWRKTFQNYDFAKMPISRTEKEYQQKVRSTAASFAADQTMRSTIESNFENFQRFSSKPHPEKAHKF